MIPPVRAMLLAHPAKHTLSPSMHNAALNHLGIFAQYQSQDIKPESLDQQLMVMRQDPNFWGANLSIPHKEIAVGYMDALSKEAKEIKAINTIIVRQNMLIGHNTDAQGFMADLKAHGWKNQNQTVLVLGAGGAARAIVYALVKAGCNVLVYNRTAERAQELAQDLGAQSTNDIEAALQNCDLLVNTTSVGLEDLTASPLPDGLMPKNKNATVMDIVYKPLQTKLLIDAKHSHLKTIDGLGMLVHQGALALNIWLDNAGINRKADVGIMRAAAMSKLLNLETAR